MFDEAKHAESHDEKPGNWNTRIMGMSTTEMMEI